MYAAPVGLGCYFAATVGHLGPQIINGYLNAFLLYLILTVIYFLVQTRCMRLLQVENWALKSFGLTY